ncbi:hypothetical protein L21SP2_0568 [Salinispira pacifica]|uniref:Uncharacterized protein n=1 Tax=Salinispira pacifica TaxID=1307761 RepID=V5WEE4_9SPIO|nr:hypothetical protein L21SP2_0568 [Salinispira pacifica]
MYNINPLMKYISFNCISVFCPYLLNVDESILPFTKQNMLKGGNWYQVCFRIHSFLNRAGVDEPRLMDLNKRV